MDDLEPVFLIEAEKLLESGDARKAAELCTRGLVKYPDYKSAYLILLHSLEDMGDFVQMKEVFEDAPNILKISPQVQELLKRNDIATVTVAEKPIESKVEETTERKQQEQVSLQQEINKAVRDDQIKPSLLEKLTQKQSLTDEQDIEIKETLTLAKIYEQQDAYEEALTIYKQLQDKTSDKSIYANKIIELEAILENSEK